MKLHISPEIARASYDRLRAVPPFHRWSLPPAEQVAFVVRPMRDSFAELEMDPERLYINTNRHSTLAALDVSLAHEMIHMRLFYVGMKNWNGHGAAFKTLAERICRIHSWDIGAF